MNQRKLTKMESVLTIRDLQRALERMLKRRGTDVRIIIRTNFVPASTTIKGAFRISYYVYSISSAKDKSMLFTVEKVVVCSESDIEKHLDALAYELLEKTLEYCMNLD